MTDIFAQREALRSRELTPEEQQLIANREAMRVKTVPNTDWLTRDTIRIEQNKQESAPSLLQTASQVLAPIDPENSTLDERLEHNRKQHEINQAQQAILFAAHKAKQTPTQHVSDEELSKAIGGLPVNTPQIRNMALEEYVKQAYQEALTPDGALSEQLANDEDFYKTIQEAMRSAYVTPNAIKAMKDAYQFKHIANGEYGFWNTLGRAFGNSNSTESNVTQLLEDKNYQDYSARQMKADFLYRRDSDGVGFDTANVIADMVNPLLDKWYITLPSLAFAPFTGGYSAYIGSGLVLGWDSFKRQQAEAVDRFVADESLRQGRDISGDFSKADVDHVLDNTWMYSAFSAGLDVAGDFLLGRFGITPLIRMAKGSKLGKLADKTAENVAQADKIGQTMIEKLNLKELGKNFLTQTAGEVVTEGAQGAVMQVGMNRLEGRDTFSDVGTEFVENAKQAFAPSAIIAGGLTGTHGAARLLMHSRDLLQLRKNMVDRQSEAVAGNSDMFEQAPESASRVFNTAPVYVDVSTAYAQAELAGFDLKDVNPHWTDDMLKDAIANGDRLAVSQGDLARLTKENPELQAFISQYTSSDPTIDTAEEIAKRTNAEELKKTAQLIAQDLDKRIKDNASQEAIEGDIRQSLHSLGGNLQAEQIDNTARIHGVYVRSLSELTGISMDDLFDVIRPAFKVKEDVYDTTITLDKNGKAVDANGKPAEKEIGYYDPSTNTVLLNQDADLHTVLHEQGHFFLMALQRVVNDQKLRQEHGATLNKIADILEQIKAELNGKDIDLNNINAKSTRDFEELFVNQFLQYIIGVHEPDTPMAKTFANFSRWLGSMKQYSLHDQNLHTPDAAKSLSARYRQRFGKEAPQVSSEFKVLMDVLFNADRQAWETKTSYAPDDYLADLDVSKFDPETLAEMQQVNSEIGVKTQEAATELYTKDVRFILNDNYRNLLNKLKKVVGLQKNSKDAYTQVHKPERVARAEKIRKQLDELVSHSEALQDKFIEFYNAEKEKLEDKFKRITALKGDINRNDAKGNLSEDTFNELDKRGFLVDGGRYFITDLDLIAKELNGTLRDPQGISVPRDLGNMGVDQLKQLYNGVNLCDMIAQAPTIEDMASINAYQRLLEERSKDSGVVIAREAAEIKTFTLDLRKKMNYLFTQHLNKLVNGKLQTGETIRKNLSNLAKYHVRQVPYKQLNPKAYIKQAAKNGMDARTAMKKGDLALAAKMLRTEHYNLERAIEAQRLKNKVDTQIASMQKFSKRTNKSLTTGYHTYNVDIVNILRFGMQKLGFVTTIENLTESQKQVIELYPYTPDLQSLVEQVIPPNRDMMAESTTFKSYRNATVAEIETAMNTLEKLKDAAYAVDHAENEGQYATIRRIRQDIFNELKDAKTSTQAIDRSVEGNKKYSSPEARERSKIGSTVREWFMRSRTALNEFQKMGGSQLNTMVKWLYKPLADAEAKVMEGLTDVRNQLTTALDKFDGHIDGDIIYADELELRNGTKWALGANGDFKGTPRWELFGMILHMGNRSNLLKFLDGYLADHYEVPENATPHQRQLIRLRNLAYKELQWNKFFNRMIDEGVITKGMMDAAQGVWNTFASLETDLQKAARKVRGYGFERVQPRKLKVKFKDGEEVPYNGGYVPAVSNKFAQDDFSLMMNDEKALQNYINEMTPSTFDGFLETRSGTVQREICINPFTLLQQLQAELRYIHVQPAATQAMRIIHDPDLRREFDRVNPNFIDRIYKPFVNKVVNMRRSENASSMQEFANATRAVVYSAGRALMIGNLPNAVQQFANLATLANRCSSGDMWSALTQYWQNGKELKDRICAESVKMKARFNEHNDGVNVILNQLFLNPNMYNDTWKRNKAKLKEFNQLMVEHSYFAQKFLQDRLDIIAYVGCKENFIRNHANDKQYINNEALLEKDAIAYAEISVVQTQMSFNIADLSAMETGGAWEKAFLQFGGYFFNQMRLAGSEMEIVARNNGYDYGRVGLWANLSLIQLQCAILPAVLGELIMQAFKGNLNDSEDRWGALTAIGMSVPSFYFAGLPYVGKMLTGYMQDAVNGTHYQTGNPMFDTPAYSMAKNGISAIKRMIKNGEITSRDVRAVGQFLALTTGQSWLSIFAKTGGYMTGVASGEITPTGGVDYIRGVLTGFTADSTKNK